VGAAKHRREHTPSHQRHTLEEGIKATVPKTFGMPSLYAKKRTRGEGREICLPPVIHSLEEYDQKRRRKRRWGFFNGILWVITERGKV